MSDSSTIKIPLRNLNLKGTNKALNFIIIIIASIYMLFLLFAPQEETLTMIIVCTIMLLFFSVMWYLLRKKISRILSVDAPCLIVSSEGISDNFSSNQLIFLPWSTIKEISLYRRKFTKKTLIKVKKPREYIQTRKSWSSKFDAFVYYFFYGSPVEIFTRLLDIQAEDLASLLKKSLEQYQ